MPQYKDEERKTWYCKFSYLDWTGKRRQKLKRGFQTKREAAAWERSFLEHQQGSPDMTFQTLTDLYLEDIRPRIKEASLYTKNCIIKRWLLPYFGEMKISSITPATVRKWQTTLTKPEKGKAPTRRHMYNIESQFVSIMGFAVKYYGLPENPHLAAGYIGTTKGRKMRYWTKEEFDRFLAAVTEPTFHMLFETLFYTGMRIGELLALTPEDINFDKGFISVSKTFTVKNKGSKVTAPKTENSYRQITIPQFLQDKLKNYLGRIYSLEAKDRIFDVNPQLVRCRLISYSKAAGMDPIRIHELRHSHVSMLIDLGFTPHLIAERIGDTVDMVNNVYGHLYPSRHNEVADRLQQLVSK